MITTPNSIIFEGSYSLGRSEKAQASQFELQVAIKAVLEQHCPNLTDDVRVAMPPIRWDSNRAIYIKRRYPDRDIPIANYSTGKITIRQKHIDKLNASLAMIAEKQAAEAEAQKVFDALDVMRKRCWR